MYRTDGHQINRTDEKCTANLVDNFKKPYKNQMLRQIFLGAKDAYYKTTYSQTHIHLLKNTGYKDIFFFLIVLLHLDT